MSIKVLKLPSTQGGPFQQGDQLVYNLPQDLNIVSARHEYLLQVLGSVEESITFGDGIKTTTPDILWSNATMKDTNGIIDQSPDHKIRKCNEWEYEKNWLQKNCNTVWGYEDYDDEYGDYYTPFSCGGGVYGPPKLIIHPLERYFDRANSAFTTTNSTEINFEVDPDLTANKFVSRSFNGLLVARDPDACDNTAPAGGSKAISKLTITDTGAFADLAECRLTYYNGAKVLVKYTDNAVDKVLILTLTGNCSQSGGGKFELNFTDEYFTDVDDAPITNITCEPYQKGHVIELKNFDISAASKIVITNGSGKKRLTLGFRYPSADAVPVKVGQTILVHGTGYLGDVPKVLPQLDGTGLKLYFSVYAVNWTGAGNDVTIDLNEDLIFDCDPSVTIRGAFLTQLDPIPLVPANTLYQIVNPHLILYVASSLPKQMPQSYLMPISQPLNFNINNRLALEIDLKPNCRLVCLYTPTLTNSLSVLDNAVKYRLKLDGIDTTTRDITFLSPTYDYINLISNYGSIKPIARIKQDPKIARLVNNGPTTSLAFISQVINGNSKLSIDVRSTGNMSTKILYLFQFIEMPI